MIDASRVIKSWTDDDIKVIKDIVKPKPKQASRKLAKKKVKRGKA